MSVTQAKRKLHNFAKNGHNWRLAGLYLAHPEVRSGFTEQDVGKAWPTTNTEYRRLGLTETDNLAVHPEKTYTVDDNADRALGYPDDGYNPARELAAYTKESDWDEGPFGEKTIHADRAISRSLAFEDSIANLDVLFRKEIADTVIEGARKAEIARDATTVIDVDRQKGDHPRGQSTQFAPEVSEGGAIRDDAENPDTVSWDTSKHGQGAKVSEELMNQSLVDVVSMQMEWLGHSCEMALNRVVLNEAINGADSNNDVDSSGENNRGYASINEAIHQVEKSDHEPDSVWQHPTFTKTLFDTAESNAIIPFANEFGDDEGVRDRVAFPLLGLTGYRGSNGVYNGASNDSNVSGWDYTAADECGAVVYDSDLLATYLFRDIEVKEYEDPVRDVEGINARIEMDASYWQSGSAARIFHSTS